MRRWCYGLAAAFAAALVMASCSSEEKEQAKAPSREEVYAAVQASTAPDTDGDGLPDDVEVRYGAVLGTDPALADTDGDGANDAVEVFGTSWIWFQSQGQAGPPAGGEKAGVVNRPTPQQEADAVDSDGDGVPDWVEWAGYTYDWAKARFVPTLGGIRTDPLQWSTDQDAYSDGMEVSGLNMDVAVREPGNHPLIPAYPDISVELSGYTLTLSDTIETQDGGLFQRGETWSRETTRESSIETEVGLEMKVGANVSLTDLGCSMEVTTSMSVATTDTTSVACAQGGSIMEESSWSTARSHNPNDAAHMKLMVKVRNLGTAPASNIVPTLSLRIGGADVATFEPPSLSITTLMPGAAFPPDEDVNWVIDRVADDLPLALNDWELRALESRAPVSLGVAQKRADVMRLEDGRWERVGEAGDYLARIMSMTTDLFVDVGAGPDGIEGNYIHTRVATDDGPTSPRVTLAEALAWSMNFRVAGDHYAVDLKRLDGSVLPVALTGSLGEDGELLDDEEWRWQVDALTLARNFLVPPPTIDLAELLSLRLGPSSRIALRAPRRVAELGPTIHAAWANPSTSGYHVVTCVSDYDGLQEVLFEDRDGTTTPLRRDGRGPFFYSGTVTGELVGNGAERIVAVSTRQVPDSDPIAYLTTRAPVRVIHTSKPLPPVIEAVSYAPVNQRLYARVRSPTAGITWVRVYHPSYVRANTGETEDGYITLRPVSNLFEDPNGYDKRPFWGGWQTSMRLVAYSSDGLYTVEALDQPDDRRAYRAGAVNLHAAFDWTATDWWYIQQTDLELPPPAPVVGFERESDSYGNPGTLLDWWRYNVTGGHPEAWTPAHGLADVYLRDSQGACSVYYLGFYVAGMKAPGTGADYYASITRRTIADYRSMMKQGWLSTGGEALEEPFVGNVFLFETTDGRLGKMLVTGRAADGRGWPYENCWTTIATQYTVFVMAGDP